MQTWVGPMLAVLVFVRLHEIYSVDLGGLVLLSSISLALTFFLPLPLPDSVSSEKIGLLETSHLDLRVSKSLSVPLSLCPSVLICLSVSLSVCLYLSLFLRVGLCIYSLLQQEEASHDGRIRHS